MTIALSLIRGWCQQWVRGGEPRLACMPSYRVELEIGALRPGTAPRKVMDTAVASFSSLHVDATDLKVSDGLRSSWCASRCRPPARERRTGLQRGPRAVWGKPSGASPSPDSAGYCGAVVATGCRSADRGSGCAGGRLPGS